MWASEIHILEIIAKSQHPFDGDIPVLTATSLLILAVQMTPVACGSIGSSVRRSENWNSPSLSMGPGRHTTTTLILAPKSSVTLFMPRPSTCQYPPADQDH